MDRKETGYERVDTQQSRAVVNTIMNLRFVYKDGKFFHQLPPPSPFQAELCSMLSLHSDAGLESAVRCCWSVRDITVNRFHLDLQLTEVRTAYIILLYLELSTNGTLSFYTFYLPTSIDVRFVFLQRFSRHTSSFR
jgi:hypothetical protein